MPNRWAILLAAAAVVEVMALGGALSQPKTKPNLDYGFYKARVEPIFLKKKAGHTRCVVCHSESNNFFKLEAMSAGAKAWNDEQSRKNFEVMQRVAAPGNLKSRLLLHPLAEEAGGDFFHNGGKHFTSQDDMEWQTLKAFVLGQSR